MVLVSNQLVYVELRRDMGAGVCLEDSQEKKRKKRMEKKKENKKKMKK